MILFERDWKRYPSATVHHDTKNESWSRMSALYREMGIRNHLFPLALLQPELREIDPHSKNLTDEEKLTVILETKYNPWYYFRECVRIPPMASTESVPMYANRGVIAMIWLFMCHITLALIQPRQTGKSVGVDTLMNWLIEIGMDNSRINMITKDDTLRKENVNRMKKIRELLPPYLINISKQDSDNHHEITCKAKQNIYRTAVGQKSESDANKLGRGLTAPVAHIDESPFISFIGTTLPAAFAAGTAARKEAEKFNRPFGNIMTTTAGKLDDRDGKYIHDMIQTGAVWSEKFLDAQNLEHLKKLVRHAGGGRLLVNATFSHRQLGFTDEWLYEAITNSNASGPAADRDFFNIWSSGTQRSPLSTADLEKIRSSEMEIQHHEIFSEGYMFRWYLPEHEIASYMEEGSFILGMDSSEAVGQDDIALLLIDIRSLDTVGAATVNETNLLQFSKFLSEFLCKYKNVVLMPERRSTGIAITDALLIYLPAMGEDPFKRIYNRVVDNDGSDLAQRRFKEIKQQGIQKDGRFYDRFKKEFGHPTGAASRDTLYSSVLQSTAKMAADRVHDSVLSSQIRSLMEKNGRIDHGNSGHDDMVIAWLLAHWMLRYTRNLSYYNIDSSDIMSQMKRHTDNEDPAEIFNDERQKQIRKEIEVIVEKLKKAPNTVAAERMENRLYSLDRQLTDRESENTSIEGLLAEVREKRHESARKRNRNAAQLDRKRIWRR